MTYRTQDPSALQVRIAELERENERLRDGKVPFGEWAKLALLVAGCLCIPAIIGAAMYSKVEGNDECSYQCATQGGRCDDSAESGFICYHAGESGFARDWFTVPRRGRR